MHVSTRPRTDTATIHQADRVRAVDPRSAETGRLPLPSSKPLDVREINRRLRESAAAEMIAEADRGPGGRTAGDSAQELAALAGRVHKVGTWTDGLLCGLLLGIAIAGATAIALVHAWGYLPRG